MADEAGGTGRGGPAIPDLDVPSMRPATPRVSAAPGQPSKIPETPKVRLDDLGDDFGAEFERSPAQSMQPSRLPGGASFGPPGKQIAIDVSMGSDGDAFGDMEIERGGSTSLPPMSPGRPPMSSGRPPMPASRPSLSAGSGLELGSTRPRPSFRARAHRGPSTLASIFAWFLTIASTAGAFAGLVRVAHRPGRSFAALLPHAFDATSAKQSGAFALTALALSIAIGYGGLKARGRSWAMVSSAAMLLIAALAMVTVTLVATDETPTPADGALLIPYVMPLAIVLFGFGVASRGLPFFHDRGARRVLTLVVGLLGGALIFAGIELSFLARFLPNLR